MVKKEDIDHGGFFKAHRLINENKKNDMKNFLLPPSIFLLLAASISCGGDDTAEMNDEVSGDAVSAPITAFNEFNTDAVTISFDGDEITITSTALPNHTTPYWEADDPLYMDPIIADESRMSPGRIVEGSYSLTVSAAPGFAANPSETGLGAIGISVTGVPIFNGSEGPTNVSTGVASGMDWAGGHGGPSGYHYHLEARDAGETSPLTIDDDKLLGIMSDGFLIYGRKCSSTEDYPTDGDASNGHFSTTQHSDEAFYHYHIVNESYLNQYYMLFGFVDLQGTPSTIM